MMENAVVHQLVRSVAGDKKNKEQQDLSEGAADLRALIAWGETFARADLKNYFMRTLSFGLLPSRLPLLVESLVYEIELTFALNFTCAVLV